MLKSGWAALLSFFIAVGVQFAPVPDSWRWGITIAAVTGIAVSLIGLVLTRDVAKKTTQNIEVVAPKQSGSIMTAGGDIHQNVYHGAEPPSDTDEASPLLVAHDQLIALLHEGDGIIIDFYRGLRPESESVDDYIEKVRAFARRRIFNLGQKEWDRFERELDGQKLDELTRKKTALEDAGRLLPVFVDPYPTVDFDRIFTRVERLRELLAFMTGKYEESTSTPPIPTPRATLKTDCGSNISGCSPVSMWHPNMPVRFLRMTVHSEWRHAPLKNCWAQLYAIYGDKQLKWGDEDNAATLTFAPGENDDATSKTLYYCKPEFVDIIAVRGDGQLFPGTKNREWHFLPPLVEIFHQHGEYLLTVVIRSESVQTHRTYLNFTWTGDYETSALRKITGWV